MTDTIRLLLCDDHPLVADGLAAVLGMHDDIDVVGVAGSAAEAVAAVAEHEPDVVLMDYELSGPNGIDATKVILERTPATRVVMFTSFSDDDILVGAIEAGATGFVTKHSSSEELTAAVRLAAAGELVVPANLLTRLLPRLGRSQGRGIDVSPREREILQLLASGASNAGIARSLHLSPNTIRNHLARIYARLGARSRLEAVAIAVREGIIDR